MLADPEGSALADVVRTGSLGRDGSYLVEGIGGSIVPKNLDVTLLHRAEVVSDEESFATARLLIRDEGLFVGGSSGTAVAAALRVAAELPRDAIVVALLADAMDRYASLPWLLESPP